MEGQLPEAEVEAVEEAVAEAGPETLADIAWLRKFSAATGYARAESPPQEVRDALVDMFEARKAGRRPPGLVERMLAGLAFDSNLRPAAGLRSMGAQRSRRQLIYYAGSFDLIINLLARGADNDLDLDGQALAREGEGPGLLSVQLLHDGRELALSAVDEMGSFAFQGIPSGSYELILSAGETEISIDPFDVGL
jgi:hypothetical protein